MDSNSHLRTDAFWLATNRLIGQIATRFAAWLNRGVPTAEFAAARISRLSNIKFFTEVWK